MTPESLAALIAELRAAEAKMTTAKERYESVRYTHRENMAFWAKHFAEAKYHTACITHALPLCSEVERLQAENERLRSVGGGVENTSHPSGES